MVKELVISLVTNAVIAAAAAIPSLGSSLAARTAWASAKVAMVMGKVAKTMSKMCMKLSKLTRKIGPLSRAFTKAGQALAKMATKYGKMASKSIAAGEDAAASATEAAQRADRLSQNAHTASNPMDRQADISNAQEASNNAARETVDNYNDIEQPAPGKKANDVAEGADKQYGDTDTGGNPADDIQRL